ncbi:MAG: hypothetical protein QXH19_02480 [Candidatus Bathyarchaeia archaeon]
MMRISLILNVYMFKVKVFFGAIRASRASVALLLLYTIGFLPSVFGFLTLITNAVKQEAGVNVEFYVEVLSAIASGIMVFAILLSLRGYMVFDYEQNILLTSPIRPRELLIASIFADLTLALVFANPILVLYILLVFSLNLSALSAITMLLAILLFIFMLILLKISLSIMKSLYGRRWINAFTSMIMLFLMLPALSLFLDISLNYSSLPYPSKFLAEILLGIIYDCGVEPLSLLSLTSYFLLSLAFFMVISEKNFFPMAGYAPFVSPFDVSMRTQTLKIERSIRTFSRMGAFLTLNPESKSLLSFLMKKEFIRMLREGSFFGVLLLYLVVLFVISITSIVPSQGAQRPPPQMFFTTFFIGVYSLITPLILVGNWRFSDLENLWIPLTSGADMRMVIKALAYDFILISSVLPAIIILILSITSNINPLLPLILVTSTSMIGCPVNLYITIKFLGKKRRGTPSIFVSWASMLLSALLLTPTYILVVLISSLALGYAVSTPISAIILVYSAVIMMLFMRSAEREILTIEV